jgi:CheY-like chemotaxis protein
MKTVLVSYEDLAVCTVMFQLLTKAGYDVLVAPPSAALSAARVHRPVDVLVTDYVPPTAGRRDLAGRLRVEQPGLHVLYAPGADGPIEASSFAQGTTNAARVVTAVEALSAPDAASRWGFCAV